MQQVTKELRTHSIWSWGWATFSQAGIDQDKGEAVCVYLWVRDPKLCSGPGAAGPAMDASLTVGQLDQLAPGVRLPAAGRADPRRAPWRRSRARSATATSPRASCSSGSCSSRRSSSTRAPVLAAELAFVDDHFRGSVSAVPRRARADPADADGRARRCSLDELRRDAVRARFRARAPERGGDRGVPPHLRGAAGAPGRDRAPCRVARRPEPRPRGRDVRARRGSSRCRAAAASARSTGGSR